MSTLTDKSLTGACAKKADEILGSLARHDGPVSTSLLILTVHEAVQAGAMLGLDAIDAELNRVTKTVTSSNGSVRVP